MWANREYGLVFLTRGKDRVLDVIISISDDLTASSDKEGPQEALSSSRPIRAVPRPLHTPPHLRRRGQDRDTSIPSPRAHTQLPSNRPNTGGLKQITPVTNVKTEYQMGGVSRLSQSHPRHLR